MEQLRRKTADRLSEMLTERGIQHIFRFDDHTSRGPFEARITADVREILCYNPFTGEEFIIGSHSLLAKQHWLDERSRFRIVPIEISLEELVESHLSEDSGTLSSDAP